MFKKDTENVRMWQKHQWAIAALLVIYNVADAGASDFVLVFSTLLSYLGPLFISALFKVLENGKVLWQIKHDTLQELSHQLCDPLLGIIIVSLLKLSFQQWALLVRIFRKKWCSLAGTFTGILLPWKNLEGSSFPHDRVPRLLPPTKKVKVTDTLLLLCLLLIQFIVTLEIYLPPVYELYNSYDRKSGGASVGYQGHHLLHFGK